MRQSRHSLASAKVLREQLVLLTRFERQLVKVTPNTNTAVGNPARELPWDYVGRLIATNFARVPTMSSPQHLPELVAHADWGSDPKKRWIAQALRKDNHYLALPPQPAGPPTTLIARLRSAVGPAGCVFLGFDFPIGVPAAYAGRIGIRDFLGLLPLLGQGVWAQFFDLAQQAHQISLNRPFYPFRPGGTNQQHLLTALGIGSMRDLLRRCERQTPTRGDACVLFWTLGGNQVGRAAIIGWRDVLAPALRSCAIPTAVWPFQGTLDRLLVPDRVVIAETYPTEFYRHVGVTFPPSRAASKSGKRVQRDRQANAPALLAHAARLGVVLDPILKTQIQQGFGSSPDGEDPFDTVVGLLGMLNVLIGGRPSGEPASASVQTIEGWILGLDSSVGGIP